MFRPVAKAILVLIMVSALGACAAHTDQMDPGAGYEEQADSGDSYSDSIESDYGINFDDEFGEPEEVLVDDPLEGWNRFWFDVNDFLYEYLFTPLSDAYTYVTPEPVRRGIRNFFHNLAFPIRFVNDLLQLKFMAAGVEFSRFVGNTAFGLGGIAGTFNDTPGIVPTDDEDFGQTLGYWGMGEGFYIVLPLLGPSTGRDLLGFVGDFFMDPLTYYNPVPNVYYFPALGLKHFNELSFSLDEYMELRNAAIEPYSALRNAYISNRREHIKR